MASIAGDYFGMENDDLHSLDFNVSTVVDVMGFNYYQSDYDKFHRLNPTKLMTSSEDTSAFETRGAFATDRARHVITSYDTDAAPWGGTHRASWKNIVDCSPGWPGKRVCGSMTKRTP